MVAGIFENNRLGQYLEHLENLIGKSVHVPRGGNILYWRERLFSSIFFPLIITAFFVYVPSLILCLRLREFELALLDTLVYLMVIIVTVFRTIPFVIRAVAGMSAFFILGLFLLIIQGPAGPGQIWLFSFPVLTGLFLGIRRALYALLITLIAILAVGLLVAKDIMHWTLSPGITTEIWAVLGLNFLFTAAVVTISLALLFQGLQKSLQKEEAVTGELNYGHEILMETYRELIKEMNDRKSAEEEKINLEKQLQRSLKLEFIGTLADGISHDFNYLLFDREDMAADGNERILVVDDEEPTLAMVEQMLSLSGYSVVTCRHSREALDLLQSEPRQFDLVITDMTMPKMTGLELARKIKESRKEIPVILCTGFSEKISRERLKKAEIDGSIMKPVVRSDLVKMVREILDCNNS